MKFAYFLLILFLINSCNIDDKKNNTEDAKLKEVTNILSTVKQKFAPDGREKLFNIKAKLNKNTIVLIGETSEYQAFENINSIFNEKSINFVDSIKLLPDSANLESLYAFVNLSVANLRKKPKLSSELISQVLMGQKLKIYKREGRNWFLIKTPDNYIGWIYKYALTFENNPKILIWNKGKKLIYTNVYGHVFENENIASNPVSDLTIGDILSMVSRTKDYLKVALPDGREGYVPNNQLSDYQEWKSQRKLSNENILKTAFLFMGVPYMWGGKSAKFMDCSGFTQTVFWLNGKQLPRDASQQVKLGKEIDTSGSFKKLKPGDLLFFGTHAQENKPELVSHVALYIGNHEYIHEAGLVHKNSLDKKSPIFSKERLNSLLHVKRILNR